MSQSVDLGWYPPNNTSINNLTAVLNDANGVYGFIFDTSDTSIEQYGTYNWCNMPHVRKTEYVKPSAEYELRYVEVIQRHHKRTPYASNAFPVEPYHWNCDDQGLYYYGEPLSSDKQAAEAYWQGYISSVNPFSPSGWIGTCQFPQITAGGLDDSWVHGQDLYGVYHDLLGFLPARDEDWRSKVTYRVTQNVITSQVAGMLINGMWLTTDPVPLTIQGVGVDSLEPQYSCSVGNDLFNNIKSSSNVAWQNHLDAATDLFGTLDDISGVPSTDSGFHASFDHYYDNLSARQCHAKPLPCKLVDGVKSITCVDQTLADAVYRMGQWEYSQIYRDARSSLAASATSYGVWIAELSAHLRDAMAGEPGPIYFHNVAHDGSVSRLLSVLQADVMVWPGMGSEVVFELYRRSNMATPTSTSNSEVSTPTSSSESGYYVRVLFGGQKLRSSNPSLGLIDMLSVETLLAYFDGLAGINASLVVGKCNGTIPT
ncbi:Uu.00g062840.m01.CDS01 [Anthostomella pinea]|uniref:Uu.00g062840.m01.CDS01 n=1 Tax=Anthostomella pinea TaxID=933095 RepID=A0AAI8VTA9_9PEZI|nr:Uu.00g062840.m01.CDS01 [Anthostomella pinea]